MGQAVKRTHDGTGQASRQTPPHLEWLIQAAARMVRPIVRLAVGRVSCSALTDIIRSTYIAEAEAHLERQAPGRHITTSALALLTGLDGRMIKQYQSGPQNFGAGDVCSEANILEMWTLDPDFISPDTGQPAELLIHGPHGTFNRLVTRAAGRAVTAYTALERLTESGNVVVSDDKTRVQLVDPHYMPVELSERTAIEAGSFSLSRLGEAIAHNTQRESPEDPRWLQQDRWSTRIPAERIDQVRQEIRDVMERHIKEFENKLTPAESPDAEGEAQVIGAGWYYWEDDPSHVDTELPKVNNEAGRRQDTTERKECSNSVKNTLV